MHGILHARIPILPLQALQRSDVLRFLTPVSGVLLGRRPCHIFQPLAFKKKKKKKPGEETTGSQILCRLRHSRLLPPTSSLCDWCLCVIFLLFIFFFPPPPPVIKPRSFAAVPASLRPIGSSSVSPHLHFPLFPAAALHSLISCSSAFKPRFQRRPFCFASLLVCCFVLFRRCAQILAALL